MVNRNRRKTARNLGFLGPSDADGEYFEKRVWRRERNRDPTLSGPQSF
jgi:hypothetical protein